MNIDGIYNLVAAVISLAKRDYYYACKNDSPNSEYNSKASLECFFNGEWLQMLSMGQANPEALMEQARRGDFDRV